MIFWMKMRMNKEHQINLLKILNLINNINYKILKMKNKMNNYNYQINKKKLRKENNNKIHHHKIKSIVKYQIQKMI